MNWYLVASIVSSFLLGWAVGISYGTSKGYEAAVQEYQQLKAQEMWASYFNQKEEHDEK